MLPGPKKTVSLVLPAELYELLKNRAQETCYTLPAYIRQVLKRYARRLEDAPFALDDWWLL